MRSRIVLWIAVLAILAGCGNNSEQKNNKTTEDTLNLSGTIRISGSRTLSPMMVTWTGEFSRINKKVNFDVRPKESEMALRELINGKVDIAMVSRIPGSSENEKNLWFAAVAMDAVVPVISFDNPEIQPLVMRGITKAKLQDLYSGKIKTWGQLTGRDSKEVVSLYALPDSSGTTTVWNQFLGGRSANVKTTLVYDGNQMVSKVAIDRGGIGYASVRDVYNVGTGMKKSGIYILPLDLNSNSVVDDKEQFYDKYDQVIAALKASQLPSPPARSLYLVTKGKPANPAVKAFLQWVLSTGQNYEPGNGYIPMPVDKARQSAESLN
jgi:phosphate transport system substrate-binding protein